VPRPNLQGATISVHKPTPGAPAPSHPSGHTITISADHAIWDENTSSFVKPEDVNGYNKF